MDLFGMKIVESPFAVERVPIKEHKRRNGMSEAYHRRVQKKWTKRYGTKERACAYIIDTRMLGLDLGKRVIVGPGVLGVLRNFT